MRASQFVTFTTPNKEMQQRCEPVLRVEPTGGMISGGVGFAETWGSSGEGQSLAGSREVCGSKSSRA